MNKRVCTEPSALSGDGAFTFRHEGDRFAAFQAELPPSAQADVLSVAEREVVELVLAGLSDDVVAHLTGRARRTVSNLLARACRKLGVRGRTGLATLSSGPRGSSGFE